MNITTLSFIRCLFLILSGVIGYYIGGLLNIQNESGEAVVFFGMQ